MLGLLALGGCASTTQSEHAKQQELIIWGVALGPDSKGDQAVIAEFERRHPDVKVRVLNMGAGGMNPQKLLTSIVGDVAPDVIFQDRFTLSDWANKGAFRSLDDLLKRDQADPLCPKPKQYYKAAWDETIWDKQVYGIPTGADDRILLYNKKVFRENADRLRAAGLDPDNPPRTWSETLSYSKVLTSKNKDGSLKRAGYMPNYGNTWLYLYSFQMNGSFMTPDGRTCTLDTKQNETALKFMVDGYDILGGYENANKFSSGFLGKENDAFAIGKVVMKVDGNWILNDMSRYSPDIDFGVAPAPVPDDRFYQRGEFKNEKDKFITWLGGFSLAIPRNAKHVDAAWEYIKFATSTEGRLIQCDAQRDWERHKGRSFIAPLTASSEANEAIFKKFKPADKKFADAMRMHIDMFPYGRIRPATFAGQLLWDQHVKAFETALYKKKSPSEALRTAQAVVQQELDANYEKEKYPVLDLSIPVKVGITAGIAVLVALLVWFSRLKMGRLARTEALWAYLFVAPWVIGFVVFTAGPMLASLFFSFTRYDVLNEARWIGLKNYTDMFGTDRALVIKAFSNAIYLAAVGVPLGLTTGLLIALLLNTASRGMRFYRTFFYMPAIVPGVASAVLWTWVLTPDPNKGLINAGWQQTITPWLGLAPPAWLQSADWSKSALIVMGVWGAGSGMLLWLAGLKGVPTTLYEAASIDGATPKQQFWNITFPQLSPIIFFNAVMGFIGAMQEFDRVYIMKPASDGSVGPDDSMLIPVYHLFRNGFGYFKMGYASALAWMIFAIILLLTFTQFKLAPRWVHYEVDK